MGDRTHSRSTPVLSNWDTELWADLACNIYDFVQSETFAAGYQVQYYTFPFEMPVDGRVQVPNLFAVSADGTSDVVVLLSIAVVTRGGTPGSYTITGALQNPAQPGPWSFSLAGRAIVFDVKAGRWDLALRFESFSGANQAELSATLRRGRKPTT